MIAMAGGLAPATANTSNVEDSLSLDERKLIQGGLV